MNIIINIAAAVVLVSILNSCNKGIDKTTSSTENKKDIPFFLTEMAKSYAVQINATIDHIDDTLAFRCQGTTCFNPNLDDFKLKCINPVALGIGKHVYLGFTGDYSLEYVHTPNGRLVSTANLGNLYFYIYADFYHLEPDSTYSIINIRTLYNTTLPPFKG
jgi:hypothetical protein